MAQTHNVLRGSYRNILTVWQRASHDAHANGANWYAIARSIGESIDRAHNLRPNSGAGILAALSPSLGWDTNVSAAWELAETGFTKWQSRANCGKAVAIRNGASPLDVLGGKKVRSFYGAIVGDGSTAVVDRHAVAVYMLRHVPDAEMKALQRVGVYERVSEAYAKVAAIVGVSVHTVQAVTWVQWRSEKGLA